MAQKYPSSENDLQLCRLYQRDPESCPPLQCFDLHMCGDYLLRNQCLKFEDEGQCSHSHSLFTRHNQRILEKKLKATAKDDDIFERVAQLIRTSASEKGSNQYARRNLVDDGRDWESLRFQTSIMRSGQDRSGSTMNPSARPLLKKTSSDKTSVTDPARLSLCPRTSLLTNSDHSRHSLSNPMDISPPLRQFSTSRSLDILDRCEDDSRSSKTLQLLSTYRDEENNDYSRIIDDPDGDFECHSAGSGSRHSRFFKSTARGLVSKVKDRFSPKLSHHPINTGPQMKYIFHKYTRDDELSFLHNPVRRALLDRGKFQVLPSGYCRLADANQEKEIEQRVQTLLPVMLNTRAVHLPHDDLPFFICSSAAERIFEQNQITYSITSQPYTGSLSVEVIRMVNDDHVRSPSGPSRRIVAAKFPDDDGSSHLSTSDGKFRIAQSNSSIDAIQGDITNVQIDLMVCVTTSATLLDSILRKAGQTVTSEYKRRFSPSIPLVLDGGSTRARRILFVPWKLAVESANSIDAQKSLSELVKRCIDQAYQLHATSIAFPSIGTGEIGLDPDKVSEAMISAASECLHKYQMDVLFVIYSPSGSGLNQQSYRAFRDYLDHLCRQSRSARPTTPSMSPRARELTTPVEKTEHIQQNIDCKRIFTISESADATFEHRQLVKYLEKLIVKRRFALSLVQRLFIDKIEMLIALCMDYHVLPRIDFVNDELTLHGDHDSCSQCSMNLRNRAGVYKYFILKKNERKPDEIELNTYVSMKIDEAYINDETDIHIKDTADMVYRIDLTNWKIQTNDDLQFFKLGRERLDVDSRVVLPPSWSTLLLMRMVDFTNSSHATDCLHLFQRTMPKEEWNIEQVDAIENWPLYVHYTTKKSKDEAIAFHACLYSSVQSIIHYGLHSYSGRSSDHSINLTHDALSSHIQNARRSIDGKYYMFAVRLPKKLLHHNTNLSNKEAQFVLPTHLFVYRRGTVV